LTYCHVFMEHSVDKDLKTTQMWVFVTYDHYACVTAKVTDTARNMSQIKPHSIALHGAIKFCSIWNSTERHEIVWIIEMLSLTTLRCWMGSAIVNDWLIDWWQLETADFIPSPIVAVNARPLHALWSQTVRNMPSQGPSPDGRVRLTPLMGDKSTARNKYLQNQKYRTYCIALNKNHVKFEDMVFEMSQCRGK